MSKSILEPEQITALWSEAIVRAAVEQRSEVHVFAEMLLNAYESKLIDPPALDKAVHID